MADYGIKISKEDTDVFTSQGADVLLSSSYPFAKLDTTKDVSFRNTLITFLNNPPEPTGVGADVSKTTLIYSFAHGYSYTPSAWHLMNIVVPVPSTAFDQDYFQDGGTVASTTAFDSAVFYATVDATNVNYYVTKNFSGGITSTNNITGLQIKVRSYVFVEDVGV